MEEAADKRAVLKLLLSMRPRLMLNVADEDELQVLVDREEDESNEWLFGLLSSVSDKALRALAAEHVTSEVDEVSRLFDYVAVEDHVASLLRVLVPGSGYPRSLGLPAATSLTTQALRCFAFRDITLLDPLVALGSIRWIEWCVDNSQAMNSRVCRVAAGKGQLAVLQWARAHSCPWDNWTLANVACAGDQAIPICEWALDKGCPFSSPWIVNAAASLGRTDFIEWARARGCDWNANACVHAVMAERLDTLQWLRANDCPWDCYTVHEAERLGHTHIANWARDNGCPV